MSLLTAKNITKNYGTLQVLKSVDLEINKAEIIAITGSSGAGKSTLLHIIGSLDKPDVGEVIIDGVDLFKMNDNQLSTFRNLKMGFIFQFHHLLPEFTALENIMIPGLIAKRPVADIKKEALYLLAQLGIENKQNNKPNELSGGEAQRVAVCRALINKPLLVLADEPSGNLDTKNAFELHQLFVELKNNMQQTFVVVTHHQQLAQMSDRVVHMVDGRIAI